MHPRFMFCRHVPILTLAILPGGVCATCTHMRLSPRRISNPFPYYSEQHSINSMFLLCFMILFILLADFVHVNSMLDLVKLSAIFNSIYINPHFPVIRLKETFELAFRISIHPFFVVSSSHVQPVVEVNNIRTVLRVQAISLQNVPMRNDLWIVLHLIPVK